MSFILRHAHKHSQQQGSYKKQKDIHSARLATITGATQSIHAKTLIWAIIDTFTTPQFIIQPVIIFKLVTITCHVTYFKQTQIHVKIPQKLAASDTDMHLRPQSSPEALKSRVKRMSSSVACCSSFGSVGTPSPSSVGMPNTVMTLDMNTVLFRSPVVGIGTSFACRIPCSHRFTRQNPRSDVSSTNHPMLIKKNAIHSVVVGEK